jgi:hypothetical protein
MAALCITATAQWEDRDCEEYGHEVDVFAADSGVDIYGGFGSVILNFRRELLDETTHTVNHSIRGKEIGASSLEEELTVELSLTDSSPWYTEDEIAYPKIDGWKPIETDPRKLNSDVPLRERVQFTDVYPGINFGHYEDQEQWEFDFVAQPGAEWEDIGFSLQGGQQQEIDQNGNLVFYLECAKLVLQRPVVYQAINGVDRNASEAPVFEGFLGNYATQGNGFGIDFTPRDTTDNRVPYAGLALRDPPETQLVSASHDTNGPPYDFYVSTYETTNGELVDFLNSAEANSTNRLGTNMFFDAYGNVWINPEMRTRRDELFSVADSRLLYDRAKDGGQRYRITARVPKFGDSYTNHPATGISWYGAVKFCNWLTLSTGRGEDEQCYREGTNTWDWAPVTCAETNWLEGRFTTAERGAWLKKDGFRMLMDNCHSTNSLANPFNEFYKAATWLGKTNVLYGYGRNEVVVGDANFRVTSGTSKPDTFPVGFFNGSDHDGQYQTHTNENLYGIFDLSGNVSEWVTDIGITNSSLTRAEYGGSWMKTLPTIKTRTVTRPYETSTARGFRVNTMLSDDNDMFLVRIPYYICLCGYQKRAGREGEEEGEKEDGQDDDRREYSTLTVDEDNDTGEITGILSADDEDDQGDDDDQGDADADGEPDDIEPGEETTVEP